LRRVFGVMLGAKVAEEALNHVSRRIDGLAE
jgi:hypothetical protein